MTFYQKEGEATQVWGAIEGPNVNKSYGAKFDFTIHEYGTKAGTNCSKVGDTWLPNQGKLDSQWISNNAYGAYTWEQPILEQNLGGGHEKLFARTIRVTADGYNNGQPATAIIGCCVIAEAAHPDNVNHHYSPVGDTNTAQSKNYGHAHQHNNHGHSSHGHSSNGHGHGHGHSSYTAPTKNYVAYNAQPTNYGSTSTQPSSPTYTAPSHGHPGHGASHGNHSIVSGPYAQPTNYGSTSTQPSSPTKINHGAGHPGHGYSSPSYGSYASPYGSAAYRSPYSATSHPGHGGSFF